ncbi:MULTISPECIES: hypothetical protein [Parabacteroides]|jgi:hypothetical protein|uniref:hypothetical protein n=1 Tax=Parabacteroides leei TaxID=2939491 RepID=UPI00101CBC5D|nr:MULTISPECIES: hypothetical protein [Parabacteroides]MCL3850723.1 hypothetical protein [Parabacteroides leei]
MNPKEKERIAVCCVLLDIAESIGGSVAISDCPHYKQLKDRIVLTEQDFEMARNASVLTSLAVLKNVHYNTKMMLALAVCDLYSEYMVVPFDYRVAFETLMNAIDWPISFSEVLARSRTE